MMLRKKEGKWHVCAKSTTAPDLHDSLRKKEDAHVQENGELNPQSRCHALSGPCFKVKNRTTMYSGRKRGMYSNSMIV